MKIPLIEDICCAKKAFLHLIAGGIVILSIYLAGSFVISAFFNHCLRSYYCLKPARILCIGHSMSEMGIDKKILEKMLNVPVSKYCINGVGPVERLVMLKHYLEEVGEPPEYLIYDVSGRIFSSGLAEGSYQLFLPFLNESEVCRKHLASHISSGKKLFYTVNPLRCYEDTRLGAVQRGLFRDWSTRKNTKFDAIAFQKEVEKGNYWHISLNELDVLAFEETLDLCKTHNIKVLLVALPCVDILNDAEPEKYQLVMKKLEAYCHQYPNVSLIDYNPRYSNRYNLFADPIHVNPKGQKIISKAMCYDLIKLYKGNDCRK